MKQGLYLVGSVPFASTSDVFEQISAEFGTRIGQIPDGEVGERIDWITHLESLFRDNPSFEPSGETFAVHGNSKRRERYQLRAGVKASDVTFGDLGYRRHALASYASFQLLKATGRIESGTRFQVDLVPAHSVLWLFVTEAQQRALDPVYNAHVLAEMDAILAAIPHSDLSIQFDIASAVFARLERNEANVYGATKPEMVETFAAIIAAMANKVPADVPLMFHFCYGDANHKHAIEPTDMSDMVALANALATKITRKIDLIHMPVPRDRMDEAYFQPLRDLKISPDTDLYLGLIHYTDGLKGTSARIDVARRFVKRFGIATECGFGRRDPKTIPALLKLHLAAHDYLINIRE